jgi:hypothetical protein
MLADAYITRNARATLLEEGLHRRRCSPVDWRSRIVTYMSCFADQVKMQREFPRIEKSRGE